MFDKHYRNAAIFFRVKNTLATDENFALQTIPHSVPFSKIARLSGGGPFRLRTRRRVHREKAEDTLGRHELRRIIVIIGIFTTAVYTREVRKRRGGLLSFHLFFETPRESFRFPYRDVAGVEGFNERTDPAANYPVEIY